jgi:hypothetical protein
MLTTIEAEIETDGVVRLLEPVKISRKSRAIVTILDDENGADATKMNSEERRQALQDLMKHAGAVQTGNPHDGDNEKIDADLANEYGKDL